LQKLKCGKFKTEIKVQNLKLTFVGVLPQAYLLLKVRGKNPCDARRPSVARVAAIVLCLFEPSPAVAPRVSGSYSAHEY
jgi:hypothetical protein